MAFGRAKRARRGAETLPVFVRESASTGEVVAFGHPSTLAAIGVRVNHVPEPLVRGARAAMASAVGVAETAQEMSGAWLKLAPEAQNLLASHEAVRTGEGMLGVVRAADGSFAGQLTFVEPAAGALANMSSLAGTAALQP